METAPPSQVLYRLATAHYVSHALYAAAKLGVADQLRDGPRSVEDLADATGSHAPSLRRLLRLLVTEGVFAEHEDGRFSSTPIGDALVRGPDSFNDAAQLFAGPTVWRPWSELVETVRTGEPSFDRVYGQGPFEYFAERPDEAAIFDRAMSSFTLAVARTVAETYDFSRMHRVIDIGGGEGTLSLQILSRHAHLRGAVFDLPHVGERARAAIAEAGLEDRCSFVGGDFFEAVPSGYDAYLIKHVIHDWDDQKARAILRTIRGASDDQSRLLLVEGIHPGRVDRSPRCSGVARNDCNMMLVTGGRQRTRDEFETLYAEAGFVLSRIVMTPTGMSILEGRPA